MEKLLGKQADSQTQHKDKNQKESKQRKEIVSPQLRRHNRARLIQHIELPRKQAVN